MKMTYDPDADAMSIRFQEGDYEISEEVLDDVIVDLATDGTILSIEILNVRQRLPPASLEEVRRLPLPG